MCRLNGLLRVKRRDVDGARAAEAAQRAWRGVRARSGAHRRAHIHREFLQSAAASFLHRLSLPGQLREKASRSRPTRSCHRARGRRGAAWKRRDRLRRHSDGRPRPPLDTTAAASCRPGRKDDLGRTKRSNTGRRHHVRSDTLIPSPQPSTKTGQVQLGQGSPRGKLGLMTAPVLVDEPGDHCCLKQDRSGNCQDLYPI